MGFNGFGRGIGYEIARGLCDWERRQGMSRNEIADEEIKRRKAKEKAYREGYKRAFGVYPEETWRW